MYRYILKLKGFCGRVINMRLMTKSERPYQFVRCVFILYVCVFLYGRCTYTSGFARLRLGTFVVPKVGLEFLQQCLIKQWLI